MNLEEVVQKFESVWLEEKANEVVKARDLIISVLKENKTSLPAAVFALDLVKMQLMRGQLEEFLGNVKLGNELPL